RDGAGPEHARLVRTARLQRPDLRQAGRLGLLVAPRQGGALRVDRHAALLPGRAAVGRPPELRAEVAEREDGVAGAVPRVVQVLGHRLAEEIDLVDRPPARPAGDGEQPLARADV